MSKIAIDMMGTDLGIKPIIDALKVFMKKYDDVTFILIGAEKELKAATAAAKLDNTKYEIFATTEVIAMTEGMMEVRRKQNSSMVRGTELLRDQKVDALVSGGSTAAFLAACHFIVGEISGVSRPAFMPFIPTVNKGKSVLMLDVGANLENDAQDLVNFAIMASVYAQEIMHNPTPSVAILNIGEEASKGKDYHNEAYKLLANNKNIFFKGNIEPRDITSDVVDIIVTDGFTGNIALKTLEGMAKNLMGVIKHELTKNFYGKLKAFSLRKAFRGVRETFDYRNNAAALVLGLRAIAVKTHSSSDEKSWISTLELTRTAVVNDFVQKMTVKLLKGDNYTMQFINKQPEQLFFELKAFFKQYHVFIKEPQYYLEALTHNSYANENNLSYTYQRMEFLGDAILAKEISLYLFLSFPDKNEGEITNLRSKIVREGTLAELVRRMNWAPFLLLGKGEIKTKGYEKNRILADIYESMIAALYLDLGEEVVRNFINDTLIQMVSNPGFFDQIRDYKTELQEFLQAGDARTLEYKLIKESPPLEGNRVLYTVVAEIGGIRYGEGCGYTHKEAEQLAARDALQKLATKSKYHFENK